MEKQRIFVEAKNYKGDIRLIRSELLKNLTLPETGILRKKSAGEFIFFSKEKRNRFSRSMLRGKRESLDPTMTAYQRGKILFDFEGGLNPKWTTIEVQGNILHVGSGESGKKDIAKGVSRIEICI